MLSSELSRDVRVPPVTIKTRDTSLIHFRPYTMPDQKEKAVRDEIEALKKSGTIRESKST